MLLVHRYILKQNENDKPLTTHFRTQNFLGILLGKLFFIGFRNVNTKLTAGLIVNPGI